LWALVLVIFQVGGGIMECGTHPLQEPCDYKKGGEKNRRGGGGRKNGQKESNTPKG